MQAIYEKRNEDFYCRSCPDHATNSMGYRSHLHYQIELALLFDGHTQATVDSTAYDIYGGDMIVIFPNQIHDFRTVAKERYILLKVTPDLMPELLGQFIGKLPASNVLRGVSDDPLLSGLMHSIADTYYGDNPLKDAILRGYLLAFFGHLLQKMELRDVQTADVHVVGTIMNYCSANFDQPLSLGLLEKELHLNKYYISHIMSDKLHISFNDYINSLRISGACKHLINTSLTITEISEIVGFNTLRTFNRAFMKQMNCTPSEYRKRKKQEGDIHRKPFSEKNVSPKQ